MRLFKTDKRVVSFKNNAGEFLNGLTSNTMEADHNAFLTIHGKIIATFDQLKISDNEVRICLEPQFLTAVLSHIEKYAKLSRVEVSELPLQVYWDLDGDAPLEEGDCSISQKRGRLIITEKDRQTNVSEEEFNAYRVEHDIPLHGIDYTDDFILNVSPETFVSFTKGCFLGQEPVSKVHNRSKPTWRLAVKTEDECTPEQKEKMTSKIKDEKSGLTKGFIFERNE